MRWFKPPVGRQPSPPSFRRLLLPLIAASSSCPPSAPLPPLTASDHFCRLEISAVVVTGQVAISTQPLDYASSQLPNTAALYPALPLCRKVLVLDTRADKTCDRCDGGLNTGHSTCPLLSAASFPCIARTLHPARLCHTNSQDPMHSDGCSLSRWRQIGAQEVQALAEWGVGGKGIKDAKPTEA